MEDINRELFGLISVITLLIQPPPQLNLAIQHFILRRQRRRRLQLRFLQSLQLFYLYLRRRRLVARQPRRAWVFPRPQNWFQRLLNDRVLDHWWKENFRVSRGTFEFICQLVGQTWNVKTPGCMRLFRSTSEWLLVISCIWQSLLHDWLSRFGVLINHKT